MDRYKQRIGGLQQSQRCTERKKPTSRISHVPTAKVPLSYFSTVKKINAIAVDGGNRKWIGTEGSGVFVISADGSETISLSRQAILRFSPTKFFSIVNNIDNTTGEVFIGTSKGLVSIRAVQRVAQKVIPMFMPIRILSDRNLMTR